ncbi:unnamed protein product [Prorocentrum cordatum]|uniref:Uncharacterized protein n=1 Tax=Prorocentrum cordatum TaxID=2364126 RepID=A0ABN9SLW9_9DINO|nr:unnamed protein product [Polarella glacialis]
MAQTVRCRPLRGHRRRSIVKTRAGACAASARRDRRPCVISRHLLRLCPRLKGKPYAELRLPPRREVAWAPPPHIFCELPRRRRPGRDAPPASGGGSGCKAAAGAPVGRRSGCGGAHDMRGGTAALRARHPQEVPGVRGVAARGPGPRGRGCGSVSRSRGVGEQKADTSTKKVFVSRNVELHGPEQGVVVHRHAQQCSIRRRFPLHCT